MKRFINTAPLILDKSTTIDKAIKFIPSYRCKIIVTKDSNNFISGVVTLSDLIRANCQSNQNLHLGEIESNPIQILRLNYLYKDLKELISVFDRSYYPVFARDNLLNEKNLVGIFDTKDFLRHLVVSLSNKKLSSILN